MKNRILKYVIVLSIFILIFVFSRILILVDSGNFFNPYEVVDNQLMVSLILLSIIIILSLFYLSKKEEKPISFGEKFVFKTTKKNKDDSLKNITVNNSLPHPKNKITSFIVLKLICTLMVIFYVASYVLFFGEDSSESLFKSYLIIGIVLSIFISIGIFSRKKWGWSLALCFSLIQFLWFPLGTALGLILCILCICTFPEKNNFRWNNYRLKKSDKKRAKIIKNVEYLNRR